MPKNGTHPQYRERNERKMQNISQEYTILFNAMTEVENELQRLKERLMLAQQLAEETYIAYPPPETAGD